MFKKLEHEMKIHMDYLEGKIEQYQAHEFDLSDQIEQIKS